LVAVDKYWKAVLRRDELLDVLQRKGNQYPTAVADLADISPPPGKIVAIWESESQSDRTLLPQVIVGHTHELEDLWAWAFSYLRGLGPLTAQTRVLTPEEYQAALKRKHEHRWWQFAGGFVGLIVGEAFVHTSQVQGGEEISLVACRSTLSFVLARASALGVSVQDLNDIGIAWEKLRQLTSQPATAIAASEIAIVAAALSAATLNDSFSIASESRVLEWLRRLFQPRGIDKLLVELSDAFVGPHEKVFRNFMASTAEERVQFFDQIMPSIIDHSPYDRTEKSFIVALIAFLARPGLPQQISLLNPTLRVFPDAPLWLGAMQALYSPEETLAYGDGLGWRIARDVSEREDIFATPRHDISFAELQILLRSRSLARSIRFLPKTRLDVELSPGISTWIRSLLSERPNQSELALDTRSSERDAAEQSAKSMRDAERSLEAALRIIRGVHLPSSASTSGSRRKGRR
jgi:hypothetical protein